MNIRVTLSLTGALLLAAAGAPAKDLGKFTDWNAQSFEVSGNPVCSMWSQPQKDEGDYTRRGDIFVWVTHRPAEKAQDRVSFEMGYPIKAGLLLKVRIDNENYELFTDGSTAWNLQEDTDRRMVRAMRAGKEMEVKGVSRRGTDTRDLYSLAGFTAAHNAISEACGVR